MALATAAAIAAIAASAFSVAKTATSGSPETPALPEIPKAPDPAALAKESDAAARQAASLQRKRAAAAPGLPSTILTGPGGTSTPAPVAYKTLLGQ